MINILMPFNIMFRMTAMVDYNKLLKHSGLLGCDAVSLGV